MKIVQKNEILEDMVKSTINVEVLGTATMTAEEELELLHDFKYNLEYSKIDFSAYMELVDGIPVIAAVTDADKKTAEEADEPFPYDKVEVKLINKIIPVDENFEATLIVDTNKILTVGETINSKPLMAQAQIVLFNAKIKEELTRLLESMRLINNDFEGESEYII